MSTDITITLPDGTLLEGSEPIVIVGPNGSGKTRQSRSIFTGLPMEFVNALRNTRVAPELPIMGFDSARSQFFQQKNQARNNFWDLTSEFDFMLSQLVAQSSMAAMAFTSRYRENPESAGSPPETPLEKVQDLWARIYPGRKLEWREWKPFVSSVTQSTDPVEYSAYHMSDGEKAALYLASRVFLADPGVIVVDEPETHFHSLLAVRIWNELEDARRDIRFVYVTHDLTFALSRRSARYVIANPTNGLRAIDLDDNLPDDVAAALLGSASLSFYASRIFFCEGGESSFDSRVYKAWFNGLDTVVKPVGSSQMVLRCVDALRTSGVAQALESNGIIDSDYHPDNFKTSLPAGVHVLAVHEIESLFCLSGVLRTVCDHLRRNFDEPNYLNQLRASVSESQRHQLIIQRWKAQLEPRLAGIVSDVSKRNMSIDKLASEVPSIFDEANWSFSPKEILESEKEFVESALVTGTIEQVLLVVPGKQLLPIAAREAGMNVAAYTDLIINSLDVKSINLTTFSEELVKALGSFLPQRRVNQNS
ncbi:AAA family ATPase [Amycolatopsis rifamycinica]|uniref:AAA family ATPase n=1 Tax=Amycolatopsis rifamycinica TaxID=287986 RepID=UPI0013635A44|nr:AAA family ATPase [Amycolatopsis rifamycinica]